MLDYVRSIFRMLFIFSLNMVWTEANEINTFPVSCLIAKLYYSALQNDKYNSDTVNSEKIKKATAGVDPGSDH